MFAPIATEIAAQCSAQTLNVDNIALCADLKDKDIVYFDMLKVVASCEKDPQIQKLLLEPLLIAEDLASKPGMLAFWLYRFDPSAGRGFFGCTAEMPFYAELVFPQLYSGGNCRARELSARWHELAHIARAWERYQAGDECPYLTPDDEEYEIQYWQDYFLELAAQHGYVPPDKDEKIRTRGAYPPEIVYRVLQPRGIDFRSPLFAHLHTYSSYGLSYRFYRIHDPEVWALYPEEDHAQVAETERRWNEEILPNLTQNEQEAVLEMVDLGLIHPEFFPTLPKRK